MAIAPGTHLGRYEIRSPIGKGGMGEVYLAQDIKLGRTVALKILPADVASDPKRMNRFTQEARAASALSHPNVAHIYEIEEIDGYHFISMEYIEGETLRHHLARTRMRLPELLDVAIQVASALATAHQAGIIHRDTKPENIMLRRDGIVKVLDFGLAKLTEQHSSDPEAATIPMIKTDVGVVIGTTRYMSPEQARGLPVDARTDIWSLGVVLYEMATGHEPFAGLTNSDVIVSILEKEPPPLTNYSLQAPADLQRIVKKALRKEREERYQTIDELLIDLKSFRRELEVKGELKHTTSPELRRIAAGTALGILVLAIGILFFARSNKTAIDSVAVLPLANASADPNTEYLSDGITESLINSLSQLPNLRVIARSSVFRYKGEADLQKVGRELGVQAVLTGRVVQHGDALLISMEMMDVRDNRHLWGERYQRKLSGLLAMQEEIAQEISEKLRLRLTGEEQSRVTKRYTQNTEAHQLYLQGLYYWNKRTPNDLKRAVDYFQQAIDKDPHYALAYAGLADTYNMFTTFRVLPPKEAYPKAKAAATKALEIDDTLADAHTALAEALAIYDWDWSYAEQEFKRAIELNPNDATAHYFYGLDHLAPTGRTDEAIAEMKRAQELDPLSPTVNANFGWIYFFARRYDQTIEQERKTSEIDPNFGHVHAKMGEAYAMKGMYEQAIAELQKANDLTAGTIGMGLGHAYAVSGKRDEAREEIDKLKEQSKHSYVPPYWIAMTYAGLGEKDEAFKWLEKEYEDQDWLLCFIKVDPRWDSLRSDPRFVDLLGRLGLSP